MFKLSQIAFAACIVFALSSSAGQAQSTAPNAPHAHLIKDLGKIPQRAFPRLDLDALSAEDLLRDIDTGAPKRFAVSIPVDLTTESHGLWVTEPDGSLLWQLRIRADSAAHLNFGFKRFALPPGATLDIVAADGSTAIGPFTAEHMLEHGQLWTPVLLNEDAVLQVRVAADQRHLVDLSLVHIGQGYRGFGRLSKACKSGACNTDVACLSANDPWNEPRRSVGAWTRSGTDTCTGSLVNNSNNDRRMLFATATHCGVSNDAAAATVVVYWNYESPTCRVPAASGTSPVLPKPTSTSAGLRFLAQTNNPFAGATPADTRSDWTIFELATPAPDNTFNLFWAGWDRREPPTVCAAPVDTASTAGLCASIHHPGVDEKRITFVEEPMTLDSISGATGVHWRANWDATPPRLPNISPMPTTLPPSVTEPGSSGSPLYSADRRLVGVLSGGPSACGSTGASLRDQYGGLFHAWEGVGTPTTRVRDILDPAGSNALFIDGIGSCDAPAAPTNVSASVTGNNQISVTWTGVGGINRYRVFRSIGSCPGTSYVQIAQVDGVTNYVDSTVSGGTTYSYRVASFDTVLDCASAQGNCSSALATGTCALSPTFAGLTSAASAGNSSCAINLNWSAGSGNCGAGSNVRYNIYRSTTPGFTPAPANRLVTCSTATSLQDIDVNPGQALHYAVRAEDLGASPAAGQCGGVEETNVVIRTAAAFGPDNITFSDNVESGSANWTTSGTGTVGANFAIVNTASSSPTMSWFAPDPAGISDRMLTLANPLNLAAGTNAVLEFSHRYVTEPTYDGGVLEYSIDGGATWVDILAANGTVPANAQRFLAVGYTGPLSTGFSSPLSGRQAWSGNSQSFVTTRVSLADFGGQTLRLRFRFATDTTVAATGWWIDDIRTIEGSACAPFGSTQIFYSGFGD